MLNFKATSSLGTFSVHVLSVIPDTKPTEAELLEKASKERAEIVARYSRVSSGSLFIHLWNSSCTTEICWPTLLNFKLLTALGFVMSQCCQL